MSLDSSRSAFRGLVALVALIVGGAIAASWVDFRPKEDGKARRVGPFLATPYLQLGQAPGADTLAVLWHGDDRDEAWAVETRATTGAKGWRATSKPRFHRVELDGVEPHRVYQADLAGLMPGRGFRYRVLRAGRVEFEAEGRARPAEGTPHRFVAFGDCAAGTEGQKKVAYRTGLARPDYVVVTGDIVYFRGKVAEYRAKFFPVYAAAGSRPDLGAPLLGSIPFVGVPGNHDLDLHDFDRDADLMAYYLFWSQPLNGPTAAQGGKLAPALKGSPPRVEAFRAGAGERYPRMANFSFDAGDVHWTVIDSNPYIQWADPELRGWVARDLAAAAGKPWRFVAFHHPGFHSSRAHNKEQQMRLLADVFEHGGVSIVFSGHVHNYQRTFPLRFAATTYPDGRAPEPSTPVAGRWTLDRSFDGASRTRPDGIIYLTTGAGGAKLYDAEQDARPATWQPFTTRFRSDVHSFTQVDVGPEAVRVQQIDADGLAIDSFTVTR